MVAPQPQQSLIARRKAELRGRMLERRSHLSDETIVANGKAAAGRVLSHPEFEAAPMVAAFVSFGSEIDTSHLLREILAGKGRVALPRVRAGAMAFHEVTDLAQLNPGTLSILEPPAEAPTLSSEQLDFVVTPGVAFDGDGNRLGYGKGYYDRALSGLRPGVLAVGFCHDFQLVEEVPVDERDVPLRELITEARHLHCTKSN
ncbi:MAG: 5-formyltetrahydrofolate cyclo-ligase [Chrysiogenetes bacterium]|nr:5-formyltetrahydrofolate cyclo-ligase [Chrysiogenetes bacterium]